MGERGEETSLRVSLSLFTPLRLKPNVCGAQIAYRFFWLVSFKRVAGLKRKGFHPVVILKKVAHGRASRVFGASTLLPSFSELSTSSMHLTCLMRPPPRIIALRFTSSTWRNLNHFKQLDLWHKLSFRNKMRGLTEVALLPDFI